MKYSILGEDWGEEEQMTEESSTTINSEEMSRTPDKIPPTPPPPPVRIVEIDHSADAISIKPSNRLQVLRNNETSSRNRSASPAKRPRVDDNHDNTEDAVATRPSYSSVVLNSPQPLLNHPPVAEVRADGAEGRVRQVNLSEYLTRSLPAREDGYQHPPASPGPSITVADAIFEHTEGGEEIVVCKHNKRGHCILHGIKITKLNISKQIWVNKGIKRFGWKTVKVPRYICKLRNNPVARNPVLSENSERFRDYPSQQNNIESGDSSLSESQR